MGHGNFRNAGHTEPPVVTVAPSFLPTSLLPPLHLSCAPGAAPDTSASKPQAGILSHPPAPATRSSQTEGFFGGGGGCTGAAAGLGSRRIYISVCDRGCGFRFGASRSEKSSWRRRRSRRHPSASSCAFVLLGFSFSLLCSYCWDCFQPDQLQLAVPLLPA